MILRLRLLLCLFAGASPLIAQSDYHFGWFPTIDHSGHLNDKWSYGLYYFLANNLINPTPDEGLQPAYTLALYGEQAVNYHLNPRLTLTAAYVYERANPFVADYRNEHRFHLQGTYQYPLGKAKLKHRLRYDGRFLDNRRTDAWRYTPRLRYLFGLSTPLRKDSQAYFAAYNEFFFNFKKEEAAIYGEDWAFAGVGFKMGRLGFLEVGPLYIFGVKNKNNDFFNFFFLQTTWVSSLDFSNKK